MLFPETLYLKLLIFIFVQYWICILPAPPQINIYNTAHFIKILTARNLQFYHLIQRNTNFMTPYLANSRENHHLIGPVISL
jgi:hypothetical protein